MIFKLKKELNKLENKEKAKILSKYFKTAKGEYAEGQTFLGVSVPQFRNLAKKYQSLSLNEIEELLNNPIHEYKFISIIILTNQFINNEKKIFNFYIKHSRKINNWDLVDVSAYKIVGRYLLNKDKKILYQFARSKNLWQRRISIISTYYFIKNNKFNDCLNICNLLINDKHDLIHKASGWMLREIGKKSEKTLTNFLNKNSKVMPRTMLRYSIEKLNEEKRKYYLNL